MSYRGEDHLWSSENNGKLNVQVSGESLDAMSLSELQNMCKKLLNEGVHGFCFSLYEDGQKPGDIITRRQVERRMNILKNHSTWVRSFSCTEGNEHIPMVAKENNMKMLVGAWLGDDPEINEREIEGLIKLANDGFVDIAAVGNEVLYRGDMSKEALLEFMRKVRNAIPSDIPIGYVDAYYEFTVHPDLAEACDVILTNCYPFWEGCPLEYSLGHMKSMYGQASDAGKGKKIIITETGWPSKGEALKGAEAGYSNFLKYFINTQVWSNQENIDIFYFSSFDESWKVGAEGEVGAYWGIWDKDEKLKF